MSSSVGAPYYDRYEPSLLCTGEVYESAYSTPKKLSLEITHILINTKAKGLRHI